MYENFIVIIIITYASREVKAAAATAATATSSTIEANKLQTTSLPEPSLSSQSDSSQTRSSTWLPGFSMWGWRRNTNPTTTESKESEGGSAASPNEVNEKP